MSEEPCFQCHGHGPIPGVIWPMHSDGDSRHDWVERCDECEVYVDDYAAAEALAKHLGHGLFVVARLHKGKGTFQPFLDYGEDRRD